MNSIVAVPTKYGPTNPKLPFGRLKLKGELGSPVKVMVMKEIIGVLIMSRGLLPTPADCVLKPQNCLLIKRTVRQTLNAKDTK